ncbi:MAG: hypothetical protein ABEI52_01820, partial [Halobacteriaceae archaeon]
MRIKRDYLTALLNRLYDHENGTFTITHPANEIGDLLTIELGDVDEVSVRFLMNLEEYTEARQEITRQYPERVADDLPTADEYLKTILASGMIEIANHEEVETFLDRYGDPDLMAGHPPVFAGLDTNLMPWRIDRRLGLRHPTKGVGYVNGFVLATGIRDELDWDYKCHDTDPFVDAFGEEFEEYWNQPLGSARIGRLGLLAYRTIRDIQQADEIESETGDEGIIDAYDAYDRERRSDIILFSNDRTFVERARSHRLLGHRIEFPDTLPSTTTATWRDV